MMQDRDVVAATYTPLMENDMAYRTASLSTNLTDFHGRSPFAAFDKISTDIERRAVPR